MYKEIASHMCLLYIHEWLLINECYSFISTFCTFGHFVIFSRILYRCVYWMLYMLYSVLNTLLPHVGRKSVFLFMYLLHVLQYPQSTTSPTKKIWRQKETTFCSYPMNKHIIWKHEHPKSKIFLYVY